MENVPYRKVKQGSIFRLDGKLYMKNKGGSLPHGWGKLFSDAIRPSSTQVVELVNTDFVLTAKQRRET